MANKAAVTATHKGLKASPGPLPDPSDALFRDHLLGGRGLPCPQVSSSLGVVASYIQGDDLDAWLEQEGLNAIYEGVDFTKPSPPPDQAICHWPSVTLRHPGQLFREFHVPTAPESRKAFCPPGTRGFVEKFYNMKEEIWSGSDEDLEMHQEQVKSMNLTLLLVTQESLGIGSDGVITKLRFFTVDEALAVMSGERAWSTGALHPDDHRLILVLQATEGKHPHLVPIRLVVGTLASWEVPEMQPPAMDLRGQVALPASTSKAAPSAVPEAEAKRSVQAPVPASAEHEDLFLPKQTSMTVEELQEATQALVARIAPGFLQQQEDARMFTPPETGQELRPLHLYLKPEDAIRLARAGGPVTWKAKDTRDQIYNLWLASGRHLPDEDHTVACVCIKTPGRGNDTSLSLTIS